MFDFHRFGPRNQATKPWVSPIFRSGLVQSLRCFFGALFQARGGIEGVYPYPHETDLHAPRLYKRSIHDGLQRSGNTIHFTQKCM